MFLAINPRITHKIIRELDATTDDFFLCLLNPSDAAFERVSGTKAWSGPVPQVRSRLGPNAIVVLRELQTALALKKPKHRSEDGQWVAHMSMKIVYRETRDQLAQRLLKSRRNFQRLR